MAADRGKVQGGGIGVRCTEWIHAKEQIVVILSMKDWWREEREGRRERNRIKEWEEERKKKIKRKREKEKERERERVRGKIKSER